ncbi:MAG: hypothetical protein L7F77_11310 [Candidatus Magnetominusculus sp. LBB02]|nr:hypothetical protein [Candidatus Magnetominusculus sp. LBB02]
MALKEVVTNIFIGLNKAGYVQHKQQCWEFMGCGQEVNNCMSFIRSAGRRCWLVSGSFAGSCSSCAALSSIDNCTECEFYIGVKKGYM